MAQPSNSAFVRYTSDDGLSNDHIKAIAKDHLGFLWVGTVNGLNRYDGRSFKVFRHDPLNQHTISSNQILGISPAPDGWLWIATVKGLCKLDPLWLDIRRIHLPENADSLDNDIVTQVVFDSKGMVWTTTNTGICKINPVTDSVEQFFPTSQKTLGWFGALVDDKDRIWFIKDTLRRFDPATQQLKIFIGINPEMSLVKAGCLSLAFDDTGHLWAGTWGGGIWKYSVEADEFVSTRISETLAMMILPDVDNGRQFLWVGGGQSGLGIYYPDTEQFIEFISDPEDPFTHNNYLAVLFFKDSVSGDVWIGTEVGLEHYAPSAIRFGRAMIPVERDMGQFSLVSGIVHDHTDPQGRRYFIAVWGSGLFSWDKPTGKFTRMRADASRLTGGSNFNLFQDSKGNIWGCMAHGVGRYQPLTGTWRDYEGMFMHKERNNLFWCGIEDMQGRIWFGTNKEGLFCYDEDSDRINHVLYDSAFADDVGNMNITGISEDKYGRLWLACGAGGLVRYDPSSGATRLFEYSDGHGPQVCADVEVGSNGKVYAAFYDYFVETDIDGNLLQIFNEQNGLRTSRIFFIVEDLQGKFWFNGEHLLHCFDPESRAFNFYGKTDGLFSNAMTDALSITPDGEIFIGFQNAFNYFYPDRLRRNVKPPPVAITSIRVMNKERRVRSGKMRNAGGLSLSREDKREDHDTFLLLRPGEDFFEIEFAALNFNQQERNQYAYRLDGFNRDWIYTERPIATFTNLDGGTYRLHMKAANNDGVWNEEGASLEIRVRPSFYRTRWFPMTIGLVIAGILTAFLWIRRQQRRRLEAFRETVARDLHDEIGSTLSSIRFFSEYAGQQIREDKLRVMPMLDRISESASTLSESMQDIIWAMKVKDDHVEDMAAHMTEFGLRLLEARNVRFKAHVSKDFPGRQLKPEVRRNIYLIFKEAVNNAAKYSDATEVELDLMMKKHWLLMNIRDNGRGFRMDETGAYGNGNGMQNMRQRAADIGGQIQLFSAPGEGTRIEVRVKV